VIGGRGASRGFTVAFLCFAIGLLSSCGQKADWLMFRGQEGSGATSNAVHPPLAVKWKLRLQAEGQKKRAFNPPVAFDDTIYFGSTDGNFYALDVESGFMKWVFKTEGPINSIPFADEENVYFGSNDGKVYAVSRQDGKEMWSFQTGHTVQSTVTRYKDWIVFTSDIGSTYLLSPDGEVDFSIPNPVWLYHTFQLYRDVMYFAPGPVTQPHSFGAYDLQQRAYLWIVDTYRDNATWYSFPALRGKYLFYSTSGYLGDHWEFSYYAVDRETGRLIWEYRDFSLLGDRLAVTPYVQFRQNMELLDYLAPSLWRNLVIYTSGDTLVRAFNARRGKLDWTRGFEYPTASAPTVAGDRVYFGLRGEEGLGDAEPAAGAPAADSTEKDGPRGPRFVCLSARDGRLLWEIETEGTILSAPVVAGKWIVFGTDKNFFYVLEEVF
jgi:outer membrane protein assembly factor BamB